MIYVSEQDTQFLSGEPSTFLGYPIKNILSGLHQSMQHPFLSETTKIPKSKKKNLSKNYITAITCFFCMYVNPAVFK